MRAERLRRQRNNRGRRGRKPGGRKLQSHTEEGVAEERPITARSESEMDTEGEREAGTSQSNSRHKKGHMQTFI